MAAMCRILVSLSLAMGSAAGDVGAQMRAVPLAASGIVYEMDRYSVVPPQGKDWFELKRDKQNVFFGKKIASRTHSFIATAMSTTINEKFSNPEDFRDYVSRIFPFHGDRRHAVIENQVEVDNTLGRFCVKYYTKAADRDAIYARGKTLFSETYGFNCLHPDNPRLSIDIAYTERGHPSEFNVALRAEGENFMRSLKFLSR